MQRSKTSRIKVFGLSLAAALTLGFGGSQVLAQTGMSGERTETTIERDVDLLPDMTPNQSVTETEIYRDETVVVDPDDVDANDAEIAGINLTSLLIFALLALLVVAIVVAFSQRKRTVV
ncbi:MAG: hypothetical protein CVV27_00565 [Candidatus Melainabacteria bacterium HGW-Melainabacteria-1]|nr:MAG: hypothetical protein CVV27_00565 [Candidatus Melainabacteria bacterium HGW-Melainabacteria-1]